MNLSIRAKLLIYMLVSVVFFAALLIISNTFLVERYYLEKTKRELVDTGETLENIIKTASYDTAEGSLKLGSNKWDLVVQTERASGQSVLIEGADGSIFYPLNISNLAAHEITVTSNPVMIMESDQNNVFVVENPALPEASPGTDRIPAGNLAAKEITVSLNMEERISGSIFTTVTSTGENGSEFLLTEDRNLKIKTLSYRKLLDSGLIMQVSTPMSVISDGIAISSQFITVIGLITILFTVLWSMFIAHRFTKPIKQMRTITSKMAGLDFDEKIQVSSTDELSQLAVNINELSDRLDHTILELNLRNRKLAEEIEHERRIDKIRRDFISSVSHELKTPIFLIQGYADGLKANITKKPEKKDFYCGVIADEAEKMNRIVRDLLSIAKYESEAVCLQQERFCLNNFIENVLEKYNIAGMNNGIPLIFEPEEQLSVLGDPFKLEQVLTNYLNNAVEHADEQQIIRITLTSTPAGKARIGVFNSGAPLAEDVQSQVWDSFYKTDPSRTRSIGGAGLGLSIVRMIMDAHGQPYGTCNRSSIPGVEFWFELELST